MPRKYAGRGIHPNSRKNLRPGQVRACWYVVDGDGNPLNGPFTFRKANEKMNILNRLGARYGVTFSNDPHFLSALG